MRKRRDSTRRIMEIHVEWGFSVFNWLVVEPTHLKNMSQNGNLPQIGMKIKKYLKPPS